ncbi:MAG: Rieske (2Fe-2S) protein [Mameliella sp.]|nr:Rieske (2Fe-2S) protein [Mameliella sp.]|tara:strand:+ start:10768 stop:11871 length:1104 start_codon:yes stop_codon:yes gene_type:complete
MVRRPDLGYHDEGLDFSDPASFGAQRGVFGEARALPRVVYRSLQFLYLEDEAVWTREWIPVGTVHEIPNAGDVLPFTLGYHGIHVQRIEQDKFEARFNLAQHGGCRVVPAQCQQGKRTSCSFTSCGYSRDRGPIHADEGQDNTRKMYQYLGLRPERLHQVAVANIGALIFLNIDPDPAGQMPMTAELPTLLSDPAAMRVHRDWTEFTANWKFVGQSLAATDEILSSTPQVMAGHRVGEDDTVIGVHWLFPNTVLLSAGPDVCIVVLQHTAIDQTLCRTEILSTEPMTDDRRLFWEAELIAAGARAEDMQRGVPKKAAMDAIVEPAILPVQSELSGWWFQNALADRVATMPQVDTNVPIFRNVEHYLI